MADEAFAPPFAVKTERVTFRGDDGVTLSGEIFERERAPVEPPAEGKKPRKIKEGDPEAPPRAWCILVHGLLADHAEFGELPRRLAEQGFGVFAFDVRGHGKSEGPRGVYDAATTVRDIDTAKKFLTERALASEHAQWDHAPQQWGLIGYSTGGIVALMAGAHLHAGDCVIAAAVPRRFSELTNPVSRFGYWLAYKLAAGKNGGGPGPTVKYPVTYKDLFVDAGRMQKAKQLGFLQTRIPLRNYPLLMSLDGEGAGKECKDPTALVLVAEKDTVVPKASSHAVYEAITSAKTWHEIKGSGHALWLDKSSDEAIRYTLEWLEYRLGAFNEVRTGHTKR